ncbi:MAG: peptidase M4, partial [Pseudomonadota bacterium]|nr:peptidase M4 [Pseudomonadota bacterium]
MLHLFAASALFSGAALGVGDDARMARSLRHSGVIMPLEHFIDRARRIHPGTLIDAGLRYEGEHHGYVYEIFLLDARGEVWELEF